MAIRLIAEVDGRRQRLPLGAGEHVLGAHSECALVVRHPSVSRRHASVRSDDGLVIVEDLGSRNGTRVGGKKVERAELKPGDWFEVGTVRVLVEAVPDDDLEAAVSLGGASGAERPHVPPPATTWGSGLLEQFTLDRLPRLIAAVAQGARPAEVAQRVGEAVFATLPSLAVEVTGGEGEEAVIFRASRASTEETPDACAEAGGFSVRAWFPGQRYADLLHPILDSAVGLIALAATGERPAWPAEVTEEPPPLPHPAPLDPTIRDIYADAARVARGGVSVLIVGESGTGKEVLARYVHAASRCCDGPFLALNCASLPRDLLEAELFGIESGVATGVEERAGKIEAADGGSLFLDEIADMAPETQAKILRVLQSGEVFRLGGRAPRRVNVRVIAATNRDVRRMVDTGEFRSDLFHRLAGWVVELSPLRRRRADIANLAAHFLAREADRHGVRVAGISRAAVDALVAYSWPGNVRQLENEMARAVLFLSDGELLDTSRLSADIAGQGTHAAGNLEAVLQQVEREEILRALRSVSGSVEAAAERLGVSRATLYRRIKALAVSPEEA